LASTGTNACIRKKTLLTLMVNIRSKQARHVPPSTAGRTHRR
jgi:hypothetical protein